MSRGGKGLIIDRCVRTFYDNMFVRYREYSAFSRYFLGKKNENDGKADNLDNVVTPVVPFNSTFCNNVILIIVMRCQGSERCF